ncbi:glycoside hydrolase family 20 protein [Streptomyces sp. NPDC005356]|uniref:beta-N-acetylhexosaminidase n=1 Tax=Streptomyces sp. NPDC005356 TaxID=3157167 RepID=UPI0033B6DADD
MGIRSSRGAGERYVLEVRAGGPAVIVGDSAAGAYYGTRTLLQSLRSASEGGVPAGRVEDAPDRPQRGIMIDIGRKFYTKEWLEQLIRDLGWLKLNYLHLHFSENEGFRIENRRHPRIVSKEHLTQREVRELVELAARHHVTVIPEIDMPGHMGRILSVYPELALKNAEDEGSGKVLDVSKPAAVRLAHELLDEYLPLFPGPYWHIGGDEALNSEPQGDPEKLYPHLVAYAEERVGKGANTHDAFTLFLNDLNAKLRREGRTCRAWNDGMDGKGALVRPDTTIEIDYWENLGGKLKHAQQFVDEGHRVLNAHSRFFYYVVAEPELPWYPHPDPRRIYQEWELAQFEGQDPMKENPPPAEVRGAHLSVWADRPADETERQIAHGIREPLRALSQRTWQDHEPKPSYERFAALSERLGHAPAYR